MAGYATRTEPFFPPVKPLMPEAERLEAMARELEQSGDFVVLRRIPPFQPREIPADARVSTGVFLDVETTGLNPNSDEVIELAMVPFRYCQRSGVIFEVLEPYAELRDPGRWIPKGITELTGITNEMVQGQQLDLERLRAVVEAADLIVAHNAGFDRPFAERLDEVFAGKPWACTVSDINWRAKGIGGTKLEYLTSAFGYHYEAHRALDDCMAGITILDQTLKNLDVTVLSRLLERARQTVWRLQAVGAPFAAKDRLKARRYRWNRDERFWWRDVPEPDRQDELDWLAANVYEAGQEPRLTAITALERYSGRS